ncbi:hypothetical protein GCM10010954_18880 [Halobacillus andaensis]|uniref:Uncharacterized protein n=1 Tax=Halobacillus andaensis TaxID=1176239 RepID=A0A917B358_HALAA|nr:hypothetical protein [Halobacillus andaensis]MBP2004608.1 hypothetical protein [Halobacillus andaensis]GGF20344.1 hypothetical protein GCM10010954_18880 [Halobacillus andaensis]
MFKILLFIVLLAGVYSLFKRETPKLKYPTYIYFLSLSIVFMTGLFYISSSYQLYDRPIEGCFAALFEWVMSFGYAFLIPTILLLFYKLYKWKPDIKNLFLIKGAIAITIAGCGYVSLFIFILAFYGFAP